MMTNFDARGYEVTYQLLEYVVEKAGRGFVDYPAGPAWTTEFMMRYAALANLLGVSEAPHAIGVPGCSDCSRIR